MAGPFYEQVRLRSLDRVFEAVIGQDRDDGTEFLLRKYVFPARAARRNQDNPGPFRYVDARSFANLPGGAADHVFEKESDQNPGRGSRDGRSITLRFGKGTIDLPPQGRTRGLAEPSAAASPVSAAMTGRRQIRCSPRHEGDASGPRVNGGNLRTKSWFAHRYANSLKIEAPPCHFA